jgi:hypothetical protein
VKVPGSKSKGRFNEERAWKRLEAECESAEIVQPDTPMKATQDVFNFADIIAIDGGKVRLVQVKSSKFRDRDHYRSKARELKSPATTCELWVAHGQESWTIYTYEKRLDRFTEIKEMEAEY